MAIVLIAHHPVIFLVFLVLFFWLIGLLYKGNPDNKPAIKAKEAIKPIVKVQSNVVNSRRYVAINGKLQSL